MKQFVSDTLPNSATSERFFRGRLSSSECASESLVPNIFCEDKTSMKTLKLVLKKNENLT